MTQVLTSRFIERVDVRDLQSVRWGFLRLLCPAFVEEVELGRYLKALLARRGFQALRIEPHLATDGQPSPHLFDVYALEPSEPAEPKPVHVPVIAER